MPHFSSTSECLTDLELLLAPWNHQLTSPLSGLDTEWGGTACAFQVKLLWGCVGRGREWASGALKKV